MQSARSFFLALLTALGIRRLSQPSTITLHAPAYLLALLTALGIRRLSQPSTITLHAPAYLFRFFWFFQELSGFGKPLTCACTTTSQTDLQAPPALQRHGQRYWPQTKAALQRLKGFQLSTTHSASHADGTWDQAVVATKYHHPPRTRIPNTYTTRCRKKT